MFRFHIIISSAQTETSLKVSPKVTVTVLEGCCCLDVIPGVGANYRSCLHRAGAG